MANDALSQQALASDPTFRKRVKSSLAKIAFQVLTEDVGTAGHGQRASYARLVIANLDTYVSNVVGWLVMRTNLFNATTSTSLVQGTPMVTTTATDADIDSQIATDWTLIAGA